MVADISAIGVPIVAIDHFPPSPLVSSVTMENRRGGELAAQHLLELGHDCVAVIAGGLERTSIADRADGFTDALHRAGHPSKKPSLIWKSASLTFEGAFAAALKGLRKNAQVTGVFCVNDEMAAGAIRAARQLGYPVPRRLSVVGFDDIDMARYLDPPLTTIGVDKHELGQRAMSQLLDLIEGRIQGVREERVGVQLIVRGSTQRRIRRITTL
jgi:LacI family transcriptional regulator